MRLYKNGRAYFPSPTAYFATYEEAERVHTALREELASVPRARKQPADTDLLTLWRSCVGAAAVQRITLVIEPARITR